MNRIRKRPNKNGNRDKDLFELISLSSLNTKPVKPLFNRNAGSAQFIIHELSLKSHELVMMKVWTFKRVQIMISVLFGTEFICLSDSWVEADKDWRKSSEKAPVRSVSPRF